MSFKSPKQELQIQPPNANSARFTELSLLYDNNDALFKSEATPRTNARAKGLFGKMELLERRRRTAVGRGRCDAEL